MTPEITSISSPQWHEGGTGLTNFQPKDMPIYTSAISKHGDPEFFISTLPMANGSHLPNAHSLHYRGQLKDLSAFWKVFWSIYNAKKGTTMSQGY